MIPDEQYENPPKYDPHSEEDYRDFAEFRIKLSRLEVVLIMIGVTVISIIIF